MISPMAVGYILFAKRQCTAGPTFRMPHSVHRQECSLAWLAKSRPGTMLSCVVTSPFTPAGTGRDCALDLHTTPAPRFPAGLLEHTCCQDPHILHAMQPGPYIGKKRKRSRVQWYTRKWSMPTESLGSWAPAACGPHLAADPGKLVPALSTSSRDSYTAPCPKQCGLKSDSYLLRELVRLEREIVLPMAQQNVAAE